MDKQVSFGAFVSFLDEIRKLPNVEAKKHFIKDYIEDWIKIDPHFYPLLRLMIPNSDRNRSIPLKESRIAELYFAALGIAKTSASAQRLKEWNLSAGKEFPDLLQELLEQRCPVVDPRAKKISIRNANELLDSFSEDNARQEIIEAMARELPYREQICLVRFILKEMKLGLPDSQILKAVHPRAPDLFYADPDLESLCKKVAAGISVDLQPSVNIFRPISPMLTVRTDFGAVTKQVAAGASNYRLEAKIDGERIQMHLDGEKFMFFSRSGADYSHLYGTSPTLGSFTSNVAHCIDRTKIRSLILDGEMIQVDEQTGEWIPFGSKTFNGTELIGTGIHYCYHIFDILFLNGRDILGLPFWERLKLLQGALLVEKPMYLQIVKSWEITDGGATLQDALKQALSDGYEGLVVKNLSTTYQPGIRSKDWVKLKPDYIDSLALEMDLLIIGANPGRVKSNSSLNLSTFLCAVRDGDCKWCLISWVGSGFNGAELGALAAELEPLLELHDKNIDYPWMCGGLAPRLRPKYIVKDPLTSIVVQVRAHGLAKSDLYPHDRSLRFPRLVRRRCDRSAHNCTSRQELDDWKLPSISFDRFMAEDHHAKARAPNKRRRLKAPPTITWSSKCAPSDGIFQGLSMYVPYGDDQHSKVEIEKTISSNGGSVTQNPTVSTSLVVTGQAAGVRIANLRKSGDLCIVQSLWISKSIDEGVLVDPLPYLIAGSVSPSIMNACNPSHDPHQKYYRPSAKADFSTDEIDQSHQSASDDST